MTECAKMDRRALLTGAVGMAATTLAALLQATTDRLERVAATTEYLANRGEGITRVAEQVANLGERIESLRGTLQDIENDRTADLRHELRAIARLLAQPSGPVRDVDHAPPP